MRRTSLWFLAGLAVPLLALVAMGFQRTYSGDPLQATYECAPKCAWHELGSISDANAALDVGDRIYSTAEEVNCVTWDIPADARTVEFRFRTTADADSHVLEIYAMRGETDYYTLAESLALTGGKAEAAGTDVFVDTIAATQTWIANGTVVDSAADRMARLVMKTYGYTRLLFLVSTLESKATLTIDAAWYNE